MRAIILGLLALVSLVFLATPAAADPWGPLATEVTVDATGGACLGGSTNSHSETVGPLTVTVITCDPTAGNPPV